MINLHYKLWQIYATKFSSQSTCGVFHVFLFIVHLIITAQTYVILSFVYAFPRKGTKSLLMQAQNKDGGWGLHIESPSTMFGSVLTYVTLRLLEQDLIVEMELWKWLEVGFWIMEEQPLQHHGRNFGFRYGGYAFSTFCWLLWSLYKCEPGEVHLTS